MASSSPNDKEFEFSIKSQEYHSCSSDVESFLQSYKTRRRHENNNSTRTESPNEDQRFLSNERQPLLIHCRRRPRREHSLNQNDQPSTYQTESTQRSEKRRFLSLFILFLLPSTAGLALIINVHIDSDKNSLEIRPCVFHYYKTSLIVIFIAWVIVIQYFQKRHSPRQESDRFFEPLIPSHLLNGLVLFGISNLVFQVVTIVDYSKCSQSVSGLDKSYVVTAVMEMLFVLLQIYVFYTLSRKRKTKIWFKHEFTMYTLSLNLTLWAGYLCEGAVNHRDLKDVEWLRRYHYGLKNDSCASHTKNTGNESRKLHDLVSHLVEYKVTFAMEYSLLASALLLHIWLELATPSAGKFDGTNVKWAVWRVGFFFGLLWLPIIGCVAVYSTVEFSVRNAIILCLVECALFLVMLPGICVGLWKIKTHYRRDPGAKALKVDLILLCLSSVGFLVLDLFTIFATIAEKPKYILIGITSVVNLVTMAALTTFIIASYFYTLRPTEKGVKAAKWIRQLGSFCLMVSFGLWAKSTYAFRSVHHFDYVAWKYFKTTTWFAITQLATPLCIFYHFHCAVCLSAIIAGST